MIKNTQDIDTSSMNFRLRLHSDIAYKFKECNSESYISVYSHLPVRALNCSFCENDQRSSFLIKTSVTEHQLSYLVVLGGDRRWWRGNLRLSLWITIICSGVCWLVPSVSCSSSGCCHGNGCRPRYGNSGCSGRIGCCHGVCCHWCLVYGVTSHCGWMRVRHPGSWLMTDNRSGNYINR